VTELLCKFVIDWGKTLAVSAPRGIELKEDPIIVVNDKLVKVLSDNNFNWLAVANRDISTLEVLISVSTSPVRDELLNSFSSEFSRISELFEVLTRSDDPDSFTVLGFSTDKVSESLTKTGGDLRVGKD